MNPRILLAMRFGGARAATKGEPLTRRQLLDLAGAVQGWIRALLLPVLTPEQRVQMARGDLPGMAGLCLAVRDLLLSYPDLQRALDLSAESFEALRHKGLQLYSIAKRAEDIAAAAEGAQAALKEQLDEACQQIAQAAERLAQAQGTAPAERGLLGGILDGLDRYRQRSGAKRQGRSARAERALRPLQAAAAATDARRALQRLSASVLQGAGASSLASLASAASAASAPAMLLRATPAPGGGPLTPGTPEAPAPTPTSPGRRPPRRREPAPDVLAGPAGAPLDECLDAPEQRFLACAAALHDARERLGALGLQPREPSSPDSLDSLEQGDEALLCAQALRSSELLRKEARVSPEQLDELCGLRGAFLTLKESAEALARAAGDGHLALGALVLLCCDGAEAWAAARQKGGGLSEEERGRLQVEMGTLRDSLRRAREPGRQQQARLRRRAGALAAEIAESAAEERADAVVAEIQAGAPVATEDLVAAAAVQRRRARAKIQLPAATAGKRSRRR